MALSAEERAEVARVAGWREGLEDPHGRIARPAVRVLAGRYLAGLLAPVERKNGWQPAEQVGERAPDGVQRLLRTARWGAEAVRDDLRAYVVEHLGDPHAVLVVDETGFLNKGAKSVGVARRYSGTAGRIENCQIGVFLAYASPRGRAFLDRGLYLPEAWAADRARRAEAGVPAAVGFAAKGQPARRMLERAFAAGVPAAWTTGDETCGNDGGLRRWLEGRRRPYVLAVARSHPVWAAADGGAPGQVAAEALVAAIPDGGWARIAVGSGSKGPRVYDWARGRLPYLTDAGWAQWLLTRRSVTQPEALAYYRADGPAETPVEALARVAGTRWAVEECIERAKGEVGLDQYEVRRWDGRYRHTALCLLAHAFLEATRAAANAAGEKGAPTTTSSR